MPLDATDLIAPPVGNGGALTVELLRGLDGTREPVAVAASYLTAAEDRVTGWTDAARADRATAAWVYHAALTARAQQILSDAMSVSGDRAGSVSYSTGQAQELKKDAAAWLAVFEAAVAEEAAAVAPPVPDVAPAASRSTRVQVVW